MITFSIIRESQLDLREVVGERTTKKKKIVKKNVKGQLKLKEVILKEPKKKIKRDAGKNKKCP